MASVYHLFSDAFKTDKNLIQQYEEIANLEYTRALATIRIQRHIRGFLIRKWYKKMQWAILTTQRFIRGWLQRFKLAALWQMHYDIISMRYYINSATKIQALWKGYQFRKKFDIKKIMAEKERIRKENEDLMNKMKDAFESENDPLSFKNQELYAYEIVESIFHRHHLLSTKNKKGVLSDPDSNELSALERLIKAISWSDFVQKVRKMYEKCYKTNCEKIPYRFNDKKIQKFEQMYRNSKIHQETSKVCYKEKETYPPKEYYSKIPKKPYEKSLFSGKFQPGIKEVKRSFDKSKNISEKDFDLFTLKKAIMDNDIPPYYLDFWFGKECALHNILDF